MSGLPNTTPPAISISSNERAAPMLDLSGIQSKNSESTPLVTGVAFPIYETAIFTSGIFLGILITLSMIAIFKR
jgi:hydrogenase/urease accessory protein HupE